MDFAVARRMLAVAVSVTALGLAQSNQNSQNSAELTQQDTPLTFTTGTNLVLVPVVVRDANGHAVGTLTKDDFQLFDKGKPVTITKFSVEKSETPRFCPILRSKPMRMEIPKRSRLDRPGSPWRRTSSCGCSTIFT